MAAHAHGKGTVTPLSTMFPAEEARKASQHVNDTILDKNKELDNLKYFVNDNTNLINLVQRLPDELHHNIMVPFGKAAFFPGRLVHTNEFLVLLGENYFAERTAKQTVDILNRRGKTLNSQVDSLKAVIENLKAEASFFDRTAAESVEGLVEIREDYTDDENSGGSPEEADATDVSKAGNGGKAGVIDDEEYARIMSRLDELEKEELEEEDTEEHGDDSHDTRHQDSNDWDQEPYLYSDANNLIRESLQLQPKVEGEFCQREDVMQKYFKRSTEKDNVQPVVKKSVRFESMSNPEVRAPAPKPDTGDRLFRPVTDSLKAFTGSIIERTDNLQLDPDEELKNQPSNPQPSKPVSRFKMQRRAS